ncbi:MAG TPA: CHAT domain-containing protein [Polyangiaceae bacterium]|nr:CHAT domain-containing protein [Polyangiaceae bacterium]
MRRLFRLGLCGLELCGLALGAALGCGPRSSAPPESEPKPLEGVLLSGCDAVVRGELCEFGEGAPLRVWSPRPIARWAALVAGAEAPLAAPEGERVGEGVLYRVAPPAGARELRLWAGGPAGGVRFARVALAPAPPPPALARARAQRGEGDLAGALATLREALGRTEGGERAALLSGLGRVELARGEWEGAERTLAEAAAGHEAAGRGSAAADDEVVRAFSLRTRHHFAAARAALARVVALSGGYPEGLAEAAFHRALLASEAGDARAALREVADAQERFERVGLARQARIVTQARAEFLSALGRGDEALELLEGLERRPGEGELPCDRADLAINIAGEAAALSRAASELGRAPKFDPAPLAARAREAVARHCPEPRRLAYALSAGAQAALLAGDAAGARQALEGARRALPDPGTALELAWLEAEARAALLAGETSAALALAARLGAEARAAGDARARWQAARVRARVLALRGRLAAAVEAAGEAERALDELGRAVPLGEGAATFFAAYEASTEDLVDWLARLNRGAEAFAAMRRARRRVFALAERAARLGSLEGAARARWEDAVGAYFRERDALDASASDWRLSAQSQEQLRASRREAVARARAALEAVSTELLGPGDAGDDAPPGAGEVRLGYYAGARGWFAFAEGEGGARALRLDRLDPAAAPGELAERLVAPFARELAAARRLAIVPAGALRAIDFHALPWEGGVLLDRFVVDYPAGASRPAPDPAPRREALVIDDPRGDLPSSRREAAAVIEALRAPGAWQIDQLEGEAAKPPAVRSRLERVDLVHYAGHGTFGGRDGLESGLPLADGVLTAADVLALARVPATVVLAGCETGRSATAGGVEGLGLAQAFLAAGAAHVVAASRPVPDALAERLMRAFYEGLAGEGGDVAAGLRRAQLALRRQDPGSDWAAFRALRR